jgi:flagellin-like protein
MIRKLVAQPIGGAAVVVAMTLILAACGGASSTTASTSATTSTTAAGRNARLAAFRTCMQSHGVILPANFVLGGGRGAGGGGGGGTTPGSAPTGSAPTTTIPAGVSPQQWQTAVTACASQIPGRGNLQNNPQFQVYYNCLQSYLTTHGGTTLPPLSQGGGAGLFGGGAGPGGGAPGATDASGTTSTTNPTLAAARAHCAALRPAFNGGSTTTTVP